MPDSPLSVTESQRNKYVEDMDALQANLEKQGGILGKVFAAIGQFFTGFLPHVGKAITGAIPSMFEGFKTSLKAWLVEVDQQDRQFIRDRVAKGGMSPEIGSYIQTLLDGVKEGEPILMFVYLLLMCLGEVGGFMKVYMDDAQQVANARIRNTLPDASAAIRAMFINPALEKPVREILQKYGLNAERTEMTIAAARTQLDVGTIRELFWRGEVDDDGVKARMRALGFTDAKTAEIVKTWNVIPGPSDIIRMAVREAFSPDQVSALGLDEAFPGEVEAWAAKVGLKDPWPKMYWRAHWELPSPNMGFEMLHRREIDEAQLSALLKALDYAPVWHEKLKAIAYNVVTRVDARRLFGMGVWGEDRLRQAYEDMGYNPEDAESLTAWTKIEYAQGDKELTRAQVEKAYTQHIIDRREAEKLIGDLGYGEERTKWILDMAEFSAASDERTQAIAAVKDSYIAGLMSATEVRDRLAREEVDPPYVETLIMRWNTTISTQRKLPSKTDLDKFLKGGLIMETEYKEELRRLGYSTEMADRYFKLNTAT